MHTFWLAFCADGRNLDQPSDMPGKTLVTRAVTDVGMYVCTIDSESSRKAAKGAANCVHATAQFEGITQNA